MHANGICCYIIEFLTHQFISFHFVLSEFSALTIFQIISIRWEPRGNFDMGSQPMNTIISNKTAEVIEMK